jgi:carbamoyl-phosphate synthase large subunit
MVQAATRAMLGRNLAEMGYRPGLGPDPEHIAVKAPVFSFEKLGLVETSLGPEMKSTGEVMGVDRAFPHALFKAMRSAGLRMDFSGDVVFSVADRDKEEAVAVAREYAALGFTLRATPGTAAALRRAGLKVLAVDEALSLVRSGAVGLLVNTPTRGKVHNRPGFLLRRTAAEYKVPCLTSLDTAGALAMVLRCLKRGDDPAPVSMAELSTGLKRSFRQD